MNLKVKGQPVTMSDIALKAGLNTASVSRALRGIEGRVSPQTRQRIEQIAKEMGYRPNAVAASLRTGQTHSVGIIVPDLANPLFGAIVQTLEANLRAQGMLCMVVQTPEAPTERPGVIQALANRLVSGLVILAAEIDDPMMAAVVETGLKAVLVNRGASDRYFSSIVNDDFESVRLVLEHLHALGHRHVAHFCGPRASSTGRARREAFDVLSKKLGMVGIVFPCAAFTRDAGAMAARALLANPQRWTAVFAANDLIAMGALSEFNHAGCRVPADISLVGHNDMPLMDLVAPALTTVHIDVEQMGKQAAQLIMEHLGNPDMPVSRRVLVPRLIVRDSTRQIAA